MVPLVAMQFTSEVDWDLTDFVIMGILLFGSALTYELLAMKARTIEHWIFIGLAVAAVLFLVWAELAVGIFGTPWAGS